MESETALRHWRERLAGFAQPTAPGGWSRLPAPDAPGSGNDRARTSLAWTPGRVAELDRAAEAAGTTAERLVTASWGLVLAAHAGERDVLFGVTTGSAPDGAPVPVRLDTGPEQDVGAYLEAVREAEESGRRHAGPTLDQLAACADLRGDVPLLATSVVCARTGPAAPPAGPDGVVVTARFGDEEPGLQLDHSPGTLTDDHAHRLLAHLDRMTGILAGQAASPGALLGELLVLPPEEYDTVVHAWNATDTARGPARCLHELFEAQAARTPHALAVVQGGERLDYAELDAAADRLAARLAAAGVGTGDMVALSLRRTVRSVVALLGVLKSGAAYAPVDPHLPAERFRELVGALAAPVVLTDHDAVPDVVDRCRDLPELREVLWLGGNGTAPATAPGGPATGWALADVPPDSPAPDRCRPEDAAYTIFTSGSTGTPKGVLMTHAPVVNLIRWVNDTYGVGPDDQVLFVASLSFDLSVYDVFGLLAAGGSIRVAAEEDVRDPQRLLALLDDEPVTFWDSAPAALQQLVPFLTLRDTAAEHSLRLVFLSGDWIPLSLPDAVRAAFAGPEIVALGGATEAAVWSNHHRVDRVDPAWRSIPYGRPIDNARYYVLDAARNPSPVGAPGDLYIGGACLAEGYLGDPRLTAAKFVPDPFTAEPGRMYRTGDRARFGADGTIEFLGRQDHQVKIRGFRVELGEIETTLADLPGVASAVAVVHGEAAAAHLVAYAVPRPGARLDTGELRAALALRVPAHMVPARVLVLDALPVTPNGKLDRDALPSPTAEDGGRPPYRPPGTPVAEAVAEIWAEVLEVDEIGAEDNFFDLGGHSLLITQVMAHLQADLEVEIPLLELLESQTLSAFSDVVEKALIAQIEAGGGEDR
ncbi:amino acid adenylation domain-containing protein [Streptomyces sp. DSM 42041]|uniref:Amino acid adenylation domain-containing protein n=1 Tax=Streptomyces hazeniae TaxID=3075538 RepID=A0ABU2NUW9_9ACTN|nr:amino acid adenylation domain-containing protein [Streptomyces sp. DSM 42041]MDT0380773.1 amino acid adenylation domain-containing protein [Streptomyces sp. DSM 42041]